jgi:prolyl-tRNA synthetase
VESGFAFALWCGSGECEAKIKEETRATMRCIPLDQTAVLGREVASGGACVYCGKPAKDRAIFGRAY